MQTNSDYRHLFNNLESASNFLTAIANNKRLLILMELLTNELSVNSLAERVDLSQSALSQHLAKLRAFNLVSTRRDAQTIYYSASCPRVEKILKTLSSTYEADSKNVEYNVKRAV